jgi:serine/threonine protein kinase
VLHRDIKPKNILISTNNQVKLADFGISRNIDSVATTQIGTLFYMATEIFSNQPYSFPVDFWSLGCVLYEMVTGQKPFGDNSMMFVYNVMNNQPFPIRTNGSDNVKNLIFNMLNKSSSKRISLVKFKT